MCPLKLFTGYHGISQAQMHHGINDGVYCYHSWTANWNRTVGRWKPDVHIYLQIFPPRPRNNGWKNHVLLAWPWHSQISKCYNNDFQISGTCKFTGFQGGHSFGKAKKRTHTHTPLVTGSSVFLLCAVQLGAVQIKVHTQSVFLR